jgi:hypothetical protein
MRKVDEARASQPHFVSPLVTTHVMLVQQYRFDMSWQQDPSGGTVTSNYGASHGLEIIPTSRLEVGLFQPPYLAHGRHCLHDRMFSIDRLQHFFRVPLRAHRIYTLSSLLNFA